MQNNPSVQLFEFIKKEILRSEDGSIDMDELWARFQHHGGRRIFETFIHDLLNRGLLLSTT